MAEPKVGDPAPDFTLAGTGGRLHAVDLPRPARRARLLSRRRHAGVHDSAHQLHRALGGIRRARRAGARHQPAGRREPRCVRGATSSSSGSRCSPTPTGRLAALYGDPRPARVLPAVGVRGRRRRHAEVRAPVADRRLVPARRRTSRPDIRELTNPARYPANACSCLGSIRGCRAAATGALRRDPAATARWRWACSPRRPTSRCPSAWPGSTTSSRRLSPS